MLLVAGIPVHAALRIEHWYKLEYAYVSRVKTALAQLAKPDDMVLVSSHEAPEILYYLDRYGYAVEPKAWTPEMASGYIHHGVRFILLPLEDNRASLPQWTAYLKTRARLVSQDPDYLLYRQG